MIHACSAFIIIVLFLFFSDARHSLTFMAHIATQIISGKEPANKKWYLSYGEKGSCISI